jgi:hypothetical protein
MTAQYISASRRCDLPRFRTETFFNAWRKGEITYDGGYGRSYTISLSAEEVRGYIFWSKDFSAFIEHDDFPKLFRENNAVFHFTLNDCADLEPAVPPVDERFETIARLCDLVGPERVLWRFDPVVAYVGAKGDRVVTDNAFFRLLPRIARMGVTRCFFSFMSDYSKLRKRPARFFDIEAEERVAIAGRMLSAAESEGVRLHNCCNPEVPVLLHGIEAAHCVDDTLLRETDRFGKHHTLESKPTREGCGCFASRDVGSSDPPCPHGCLYCYANPLSF